MLDTSLYKLTSKLSIKPPMILALNKGILLYHITDETTEMLKLEVVFDYGVVSSENKILPKLMLKALFEGTTVRSGKELAETLEQYGVFYDVSCGMENSSFSFYLLADYILPVLDILKEVLFQPLFGQDEFEKLKYQEVEKYKINQEKVGFLAKDKLNLTLFGNSSYYDSYYSESDILEIHPEHLKQEYEDQFLKSKCSIYTAGKITNQVLDALGEFSKIFNVEKEGDFSINKTIYSELKYDQNIHVNKENAVQDAIRVGQAVISKKDKDFPDLLFVNTLLGGFFGSRLMKNIREDKGYTYGIGSGIVNYKHGGFIFIASEMASEYSDLALKEIKKEIIKLQSEPIEDKELVLVKNYLKGSLMRNFDGVFETLERFKHLIELGIDLDYYNRLQSHIDEIEKERVMEIANEYINWEQMIKVIVGRRGNL